MPSFNMPSFNIPSLKSLLQSWPWYSLALAIILLDQLTKSVVNQALSLYEIISLTPFFEITLRYNTGAAFSFLAGAGGWQRWFLASVSTIVSLIILLWIARLDRSRKVELWALAFILGGAIGNLYDRIAHGYVVDFILVHWPIRDFPAFNIADSAISIGAALLVFDALLLEPKRRKHAANAN